MRRSVSFSAALLLILTTSVPVLAVERSAFEAEFHHFSQPAGICVGGVCEYESHGYGFTNLMGAVTVDVVFTWDFTAAPCSTIDPFAFTLVGATGSMTIVGSADVCPGLSPYGFPEFLAGPAVITAGTGAFAGVSGDVSVDGIIASRGPVVHLSGTVSR